MCAAIETPGKCVIRAVIRFLQAEGHSTAEIHRRMSAVYGPNFMSDKCVREWCRKFRDGRTDVHYEGGQGRPSLVNDDLVHTFTKWFASDVDSLSLNFHWNSLKFVERFCMKLSQKKLATTRFVPDGCQKCSLMFTKHKEWRQR